MHELGTSDLKCAVIVVWTGKKKAVSVGWDHTKWILHAHVQDDAN